MKRQRKLMALLVIMIMATVIVGTNVPTVFAQENVFFSEDFSTTSQFGNYKVENGKAVVGNTDVLGGAEIPIETAVTDNWEFSMKVCYPEGSNNFVGVHMFNLVEGDPNSYEFTVQRTPDDNEPDYAYIKSASGEIAHSNGNGGKQNPQIPAGQEFTFRIIKMGSEFSVYVDDLLTLEGKIENTAKVNKINIFSYDAAGATIDDIMFREFTADTPVSEVTVTSDKASVSTVQSAVLTAEVNAGAFPNAYEWYVDGTKVEGAVAKTFVFSGYAAGEHKIYCMVDGVQSNEVAITVTEAGEEAKDAIWFEDFSSTTEFGAFIVSDGKAMIAGDGVVGADIMLDVSRVTDNWEFTMKVCFPEGVYNFLGANFFNLVAGDPNAYEFTVQKVEGEDVDDYTLIKGAGKEIAHSNGSGGKQNPRITPGQEFVYRIVKAGSSFSFYIDDVLTLEATIENTAKIDKINLFGFNASGVTVDDILLKEYKAQAEVTEVTVSANKLSISESQSAIVTATVNEGAIPTSFEWYVDGNKIEGVDTRSYEFKGYAVGTHTVYCVADGVKSNELTITVTEASDIEKESIYYEDFDSSPEGAGFGGFSVSNGAIIPGSGNYSNYTINCDFVQNWEFRMDVVFNEQKENATYVGVTIDNIYEGARQLEFNFKKAGTKVSEEGVADKDQVIIKIDGVEKYYNDSEVGGRLDEIVFETGKTYTMRVVRYDDQLEFYVNDTIAIKYVFVNPVTMTNMFVYTYCDNGPAISVDNIIYKESSEITDIVEPPTVEVTGAYVSSGAKELKVGEGTVLSVNCYPYNATPKTFQWYVNGEAIEGATSSTYTFTAQAEGTYEFKCVVDGKVESESKTITVKAAADVDGGGDNNNALWIALGCVGGVIVIAGIAVAVVFFVKKKNSKQ